MEKKELRDQWAERVVAYRSSGQTAAAWCAANNLKLHRLKYWLQHHKKPTVSAVPSSAKSTSSTTQWLPVDINVKEPINPPNSLFVKVGNAAIEIRPGFDPNLLADVVRALS